MKPILLQTIPHTGNHTCQYLFNYLGGIPTFFHHFEDWELPKFLEVFGDLRERFTIVHTFRTYEAVLATYKKRMPGADVEQVVKRNLKAAEQWREEFDEAELLPIGIDVELQTFVAKRIFEACGREVPDSAKRFLETWPAKGTFEGDFVGFANAEEKQSMSRIMQQTRILPDKDWLKKVNLALQELSN